jgi:xanthine dehydrogenase accessory factor
MANLAASWDLMSRAEQLSARGESFALATVVWRQGPSSGHQGSRAIVTASGEIHGWIGGACAEPVVLRQAAEVIASGQARLLFLGDPSTSGLPTPEGTVFVPMSCQSEGALQIFVEPVLPTLHLLVVGRSPMAIKLQELGAVMGWRSERVDAADFSGAEVTERSVVIVATQGHGDEDAVQRAAAAGTAYVGLVASHKRGEAVLGYLADRGVPDEQLRRVHTPVGLDLGHTTHEEIAVSVLAELVRLRAAGMLGPVVDESAATTTGPATAIDPVCHMTVAQDDTNFPFEHAGTTYWFCCAGCRTRFEKDPSKFLEEVPS